jgi:hypothetical protein
MDAMWRGVLDVIDSLLAVGAFRRSFKETILRRAPVAAARRVHVWRFGEVGKLVERIKNSMQEIKAGR